jgi:CheY-like chemotaxis protein
MASVIPAPSLATPDYRGCHVLICDPYLGNRRLLRETLKDLGCGSAEDCANLSDARKRIVAGGINLMFLDWSSETDAMTFLRVIRSPDHELRFLPIVVMTAYGGLDHVYAGTTEFMLRPWSNKVVDSRLRSVVQHPRLFINGGHFFGPDRRRRRTDFSGNERRDHENWRSGDRRDNDPTSWEGLERRQGRHGFTPLDRRNAPRA